MPTLSVTKSYLANNVLNASMLDDIRTSIETFINTTKLDGDNIQISAIADSVASAISSTGANAIATTMTSTGANAIINDATYAGATFAGKVRGTTTNDDAASGIVGEYAVEIFADSAAGSSGQFANMASKALSAGDWDIFFQFSFDDNGATMTSDLVDAALSANSGNTTTDHVLGDNRILFNSSGNGNVAGGTVYWRKSLSGTTTIYAKTKVTYSAGTPKFWGKMWARRPR